MNNHPEPWQPDGAPAPASYLTYTDRVQHFFPVLIASAGNPCWAVPVAPFTPACKPCAVVASGCQLAEPWASPSPMS